MPEIATSSNCLFPLLRPEADSILGTSKALLPKLVYFLVHKDVKN